MALAARQQQPAGRPRLLQAVFDAMQQPDIRRKLLFTAGILVVFRFVAHIPIPNVDPRLLEQAFADNQLLEFFNLFSGGALRQMSVASLGVYPYITASIIMQLITPMFPALQNLRQEGESGRHRIELYQHWMCVPLAFVQGYAQLVILNQTIQAVQPNAIRFTPGFTGADALPTITALFCMVAGTMFLVWLGELITENGIGNGISLIIFGGIVAGMPGLITRLFNSASFWGIAILAVISVLLVAAIVFMQEATRKIPVQYAKSVYRAGKMYRQSGQSHIPLRVNSAGMIPLIFAFSIVILPPTIAQFVLDSSTTPWVRSVARFFVNVLGPGTGQASPSPGFYLLVFVLVVAFSFFYTLVIFQQQNLAENLQKQGGFVPGIRPGRPTGEYIMRVLVRITWAGALFLGFVAVLPYFVTTWFDVTALTISSTGMLIVVGVVLDTMKQLEAQLLMRNYEGFIR